MSGSVSTATANVLFELLMVLAWSSIVSTRSPSSGLRISPLTRTSELIAVCSWLRLKKQPALRASTYWKRIVRSQFWLMRVIAVTLRGAGPAAALLGVAVIVIVEQSEENAALSAACSVIVVAAS